jgi:hypothetical protein
MESVFASSATSETSIVEQSFLVRVLGFKVWRRAVVEGRIPLDCMKRRGTDLPLRCGTAIGNLEGVRFDFGAYRLGSVSESDGGFIGEFSLGSHGCLDAGDSLPVGSVRAFLDFDGYTQQIGRC